MSNPMIIGLIGPERSGKDMVALWLCNNSNFSRFAFADKIKEEYFSTINMTDSMFEEVKDTDDGKNIRNGLWNHSDVMCETNGKFYFIDKVVNDIKICRKNAVITDIRTKDELETIKKFPNSHVILVIRDEIKSGTICGSRLKIEDLSKDTIIFCNNFNTLDEAQEEFKNLYMRRLIMLSDDDSDPYEPKNR